MPSVELSVAALTALAAVAFVAGVVDAIAGGGGLLTLPALLAAGLPPQLALGTNKGQSVFGSGASLLRYARAGLVEPRRAAVAFPAGLVGSALGCLLVLALDPGVLRPVVLVLLVAAGAFVGLQPLRAEEGPKLANPHATQWALVIALLIGAYDGFFGPGTGTFLIVAFVGLLHETLPRATASAKVVNFASNLAAVALFWSRGVVLWRVALPMAGAQFLGGLVGAGVAMKGGGPLIRKVVLAVVVALVLKLGYDFLR